MSTHTPGPWAVGDVASSFATAPDELCVHAPTDPREHEKPDGTRHGVIICRGMDGPTREANARLIAAAPELLDFVRAVASPQTWCITLPGEPRRVRCLLCDSRGVNDEDVLHALRCTVTLARAAIARAEGRAP